MVKKHLLLQSTVLINKQNTWILYLSKGGPGLLATYISFFLLFDGGSIIQKILLRNWLTDIQKAVNRSWEAANWLTHSYEKKKKIESKWKQHVSQIPEKGREICSISGGCSSRRTCHECSSSSCHEQSSSCTSLQLNFIMVFRCVSVLKNALGC